MIAEFADALAALCVVAVTYHYLGYPVLVVAISRMCVAGTDLVDREPSVTLVIAAYNEERVISGKLLNSLALDYPREKLEIIVVADGSSDATPNIAAEFADYGVRCMFELERRGKSHALNRAVAASRGEIVVLSDANNEFSSDALRWLIRALCQPSVGGCRAQSASSRNGIAPQALATACTGDTSQ